MNSEELEQSLKTEFESYLKTVLAELKQDTAEFQSRIEAEFERQRSQIDEAFKSFAARFDSERTFDEAFSGSLGEHLRLARDEGARIAADAMVEAENLGQSPLSAVAPAPEPKYDALREAVNDIASKDSQSGILKSLVHYASEFAPRGAFFVIKADHLTGWKVFGADDAAERRVRDIHFPVANDSILSAAVGSRSAVAADAGSSHPGDAAFLEPLGFDGAEGMCAIPLMARGRAVAVLYADQGGPDGDGQVNRDALEMIIRVAGLTVELLASAQTAKAENRSVGEADLTDVAAPPTHEMAEPPRRASFEFVEESTPGVESLPEHGPAEPTEVSPPFQQQEVEQPSVYEFEDPTAPPLYEQGASSNPFEAERPELSSRSEERVANPYSEDPYPGDEIMRQREAAFEPEPVEVFSDPFAAAEEPTHFDSFSDPFAGAEEPAASSDREGSLVFDRSEPVNEAPSASPFEQPREQFEPAMAGTSSGFAPQAAEPVVEAPVMRSPQPRLSDRNVDLPIEVPEEERRIHNDARRFARLLVSEIKLYNEKKVAEGRASNDLYDRLREAIDRSREMYDKRVQPPVAAKFDYFHYEILNSLAEGSVEKLGGGYPGATV